MAALIILVGSAVIIIGVNIFYNIKWSKEKTAENRISEGAIEAERIETERARKERTKV